MPPYPQIGLGVGAVDGAAAPPEAACRLHAVVVFGHGGGLHGRRCEEGVRLGQRGAERSRAGGDADEVEEVAVLARGGIRPLAWNAGGREADEERAPAGAANVTGGPVAPLLAALGQVAAAHLLGACAERGRDAGGGAHGADLGREARLGREGGPAEPGPRAGIGSMGKTSPDASGDAPGSRPLSFSRRRLAGGGCAEREPAVLPVEGLGLHCTGKGRPRAGGTRDRPRGEREGGARSGA